VPYGTYGEHYAGSLGFIAELGEGDYGHSFGGSSWEVIGCQESWGNPAELIKLDVQDARLSLHLPNAVTELPLVSYFNLTVVPDRQIYHIDCGRRRVEMLQVSEVDAEMLPEQYRLPNPLPRRALTLREMKLSELPVDEPSYWSACESFVGGESLIRLVGPPVWMQDAEEVKCEQCGDEMKYVASIGYERYDNPYGLLTKTQPFFPGEFALYFFICRKCLRGEVVCQST
jgi:hypothetical protein